MRTLLPHHASWLTAHPDRSESWLRERLLDGFHIHHFDGNHENDAPANLILVEGTDHLRLHGSSRAKRLTLEDSKNGGLARARRLSACKRRALARRAVKARWRKKRQKKKG